MAKRTSTIHITQSRGGTTIRATGRGALELFNVLTHAVETRKAQEAAAPDPIRLVIAARYADNTYHARPVASVEAVIAGLKGLKATATSGARQAVDALLAKASPPLKRQKVISIDRGNCLTDPILYTIEAEVA